MVHVEVTGQHFLLSFYYVGPKDRTQVLRHGDRYLNLFAEPSYWLQMCHSSIWCSKMTYALINWQQLKSIPEFYELLS